MNSTLQIKIITQICASYLNAIQVSAPHLTRYLAAALLLLKNNTKGKANFNTLVSIFNNNVTDYTDSLTEYVKLLFGELDFKKTQIKIKEFAKDLEHDYFITPQKAEQLINNAHTLFFEAFCKVYRKVEIKYF